MPIVNVEEIKRNHEKNKIKEKYIEKVNENEIKNKIIPVKPSFRKKFIMRKPKIPFKVLNNTHEELLKEDEEIKEEIKEVFDEIEFNEIKGTVKNIAIEGLSCSMLNKDKKESFHQRIKNSNYINKYLDKKINSNINLDYLNDNLLFLITFGNCYYKTLKE